MAPLVVASGAIPIRAEVIMAKFVYRFEALNLDENGRSWGVEYEAESADRDQNEILAEHSQSADDFLLVKIIEVENGTVVFDAWDARTWNT